MPHMPRFTLDFQWTEQGLDHFRRGEHLTIRAIATDHAMRVGQLKIISITDRLVPTPVGPIWVVEGEKTKLDKVVQHFKDMGNVKVTVTVG